MLGQEERMQGEKFIVRRAPGESVAPSASNEGGGSSAIAKFIVTERTTDHHKQLFAIKQTTSLRVWRDMANCFCLLQTRCSF